jgi:plastocyanin
MRAKIYFIQAIVVALALCGWETIRAASPSTNAGSVSGSVRLDGPAPKAQPMHMSSDPACAKTHPTPIASDDVVKSSTGGLGNVIVFISEGITGHNFEVPQQPVVLEQKGCMYSPHVIALQANQKLEVVNDDKTTHNIHPTPANNREWNKAQPPGVKVEDSFSREEIAIPVKCNVHPWMRGYIAVFKHPYFAVTAADGGFRLPDLPPGEYTIEAWHEKLGTMTKKITIVSGQVQTLEFVFHPHGG